MKIRRPSKVMRYVTNVKAMLENLMVVEAYSGRRYLYVDGYFRSRNVVTGLIAYSDNLINIRQFGEPIAKIFAPVSSLGEIETTRDMIWIRSKTLHERYYA